jgi:hypothetical protein
MTKRDRLQKMVDDAVENNPDYHSFSVEFRGRAGWWAIPEDCRYFGDQGEYLGQDFKSAERTLGALLA